jgi:molybdate transport system substrate-binding protein
MLLRARGVVAWPARLAAAALMLTTVGDARAIEVRVLTAGAMKSVVLEMIPDFEKRTGHKVLVANDTAGGLKRRIVGGEPVDVAIVTSPVIDELIAEGKLVQGSRINLAKVGIGVAVKAGAPLPEIRTVESLKHALVEAKSVAYIDPKSGGSSGIYFDGLLERLGIAGDVRPKARLKAGGQVAELVASGEADLAVHQISEIVPVKGVTLVGPLPQEIQNYTTYTAGLGAAALDATAARALIETLASPSALPVLKSRGMEEP